MDQEVWRLIQQTYIKHRHCFLFGCSKKAMANFVYRTTGVKVTVSQIIKALKKAESLGLIKSETECGRLTTYTMTGKAK